MGIDRTYTAFADTTRVASGTRSQIAHELRALATTGDQRTMLIFDDVTGAQVDLDLRETAEESPPVPSEETRTESTPPPRSPGRPKLGVVGREVTLLPRHWDWLKAQPGGASVALRKLVERARRDNVNKDRVRQSQEAAYRFMSSIAGNELGFEEASRALFAGDSSSFEAHTDTWPSDVRDHTRALANAALGEE